MTQEWSAVGDEHYRRPGQVVPKGSLTTFHEQKNGSIYGFFLRFLRPPKKHEIFSFRFVI